MHITPHQYHHHHNQQKQSTSPQPHQSDLFADVLTHFNERSHLNREKNKITTEINDNDVEEDNQNNSIRRTSLPQLPFEHNNFITNENTLPLSDLLPLTMNSSDSEDNGENIKSNNQQLTISLTNLGPCRTPSKLSSQHRFDMSSSPTPPPIPARRILSTARMVEESPSQQNNHKNDNDNNGNNNKKSSSLSRAVRSYSSGSVRSLLARKLNRTISGNSARANTFNG